MVPRLDVSLEAFYSTCDQIELHLVSIMVKNQISLNYQL